VKAHELSQIIEVEEAERQKMIEKCEKILKHGCNCFLDRQLIYNLPEQFFADHHVMAIEHADFEGIERLANALGGEIASTFDTPDKVRLGSCKLIEEIMIGEDKVIRFSGLPAGGACTIVLRGASMALLDEAERSLHDALCVLHRTPREPRVVLGGGCSEMLMARAVDELAAKTAGKKAVAIEAYARALRQLPTIIADNGGLDSAELIAQLRAAHNRNENTAGVDMQRGQVGSMEKLGVMEAYRAKSQVLNAASEAAEMLLRVDHVLKSAPRRRQERHGH